MYQQAQPIPIVSSTAATAIEEASAAGCRGQYTHLVHSPFGGWSLKMLTAMQSAPYANGPTHDRPLPSTRAVMRVSPVRPDKLRVRIHPASSRSQDNAAMRSITMPHTSSPPR